MANRQFQQFQGTLEKGVVTLYAVITTTTSGAIGSTSAVGLSVAKVASEAGRYRITLEDKYTRLLNVSVIVSGAADAAYTAAAGVNPIIRNVAVSSATPILDVQLCRTDTGADAEVIDGSVIYVQIVLKNSSV
jgi:hypothetical protein